MSGSLNHSQAHIIRDLLVALGLGTDPDDDGSWPIYVGREPNTPDSIITVTNETSILHGRRAVDGIVIEHYGIMLKIRDADPRDGSNKAEDLKTAMDQTIALNDVTIEDTDGTGSSTYKVYTVTRKSGIHDLGKQVDSSKRNLFTINAVVALRQTA